MDRDSDRRGDTERDRLIRAEEQLRSLEDRIEELEEARKSADRVVNIWAALTAFMTAGGVAAGWIVAQIAGFFHGPGK